MGSIDFRARIRRVRAAMEEQDIDLIYLHAGGDMTYLTGIRRMRPHATDDHMPGGWLHGVLLARRRGPVVVGPQMVGRHLQAEADGKDWIDELVIFQPGEDPHRVLVRLLSHLGAVRVVAVSERSWSTTLLALQSALPEAAFRSAGPIFARLRAVKEPAEILALRAACRLTDTVFTEVVKQMQPGMTEFDVAAEVEHQMLRLGAEGTSFVTAVMIHGPGVERPHVTGRVTPVTLLPGRTAAFDIGLVLDGYCSDFGRTVYVGEPAAEVLRMHEAVMAAQAEAMRSMVAGRITCEEVDRVARAVIADAGYGPYFTHRLGHGIGLDVHEPPFLDAGESTVIQKGMCFTVEPSVFRPGVAGVRVEDVVVVTDRGGESLGVATREPIVIE